MNGDRNRPIPCTCPWIANRVTILPAIQTFEHRTSNMKRILSCSALILFFVFGCAHPPVKEMGNRAPIYFGNNHSGTLIQRHTPLFAAYGCNDSWNRIGMPSARINEKGEEIVYVDGDRPAIYGLKREFATKRGTYTNLVYRIHFSEVPFSLVPFYLTAGKNVGLLVVLTLDDRNRPLLVTTVSTCGCYVAITPTSYLPREAYPVGWNPAEPIHVYGEILPPILDFRRKERPKLLVHLRPDVHRVMDLEVVEEARLTNPESRVLIETPLLPMEHLKQIPINGQQTSFYYEDWPYKGFVKDSFKSWEAISLSLISLDFFVGTDKIYGDSNKTGTRFYTSLKPWDREESDMWHFDRFLQFNGWRL